MRQAVRQRRAVSAGHRAVRVPAWLGGRPVPALRGTLQVRPRGMGGGTRPGVEDRVRGRVGSVWTGLRGWFGVRGEFGARDWCGGSGLVQE